MHSLTSEDLIDWYAKGLFLMGEAREDETLCLIDPNLRGVLPLDRFHVPARLARTVRSDRFQIRIDSVFAEVLAACAAPRPGSEETWINGTIRALYAGLFERGYAHSLECWQDERLVGGLYGVSLGGAFFGESMFSVVRDASKVALVHLVARLKTGGYRLLDAQFMTAHLARFGAEELTRREFQARLKAALSQPADFFALPPTTSGAQALQAISQAS